MLKKNIGLVFVSFVFVFITVKKTEARQFKYHQFLVKDYKDMKKYVLKALKKSRRYDAFDQSAQATRPLATGLKIIYSRPDRDNLVSKLVIDLYSELDYIEATHEALSLILKEAVSDMKNKNLSGDQRATAAIMLNNMITDIKPRMMQDSKMARHICYIADEDIDYDSAIDDDTLVRSLLDGESPSKRAQEVMMWYLKKKGKIKSKSLAPTGKGCPLKLLSA